MRLVIGYNYYQTHLDSSVFIARIAIFHVAIHENKPPNHDFTYFEFAPKRIKISIRDCLSCLEIRPGCFFLFVLLFYFCFFIFPGVHLTPCKCSLKLLGCISYRIVNHTFLVQFRYVLVLPCTLFEYLVLVLFSSHRYALFCYILFGVHRQRMSGILYTARTSSS